MPTVDNSKIFFIAGRIRSGTSLLNRILNNNQEVFLPQESPFIMHLHAKYSKGSFDSDRIQSFYSDMWKEVRLTQFWKLQNVADELLKDMLALGSEATFEKLCKLVLHHQSINRSGVAAPTLGDKNPSYSYYLPELSSTFPTAKFVLMIRDVRDNILSCQNVSFDFNDTTILSERWVDCNNRILQFYKKNKDRAILVKFEELLADPETILKEVCQTIGIEYQQEMLNFHQAKEKLESWRYFYNRPLEQAKIAKWKITMPEHDAQLATWLSSEILNKLGYETPPVNLSITSKLMAYPKLMLGKVANWLESKVYFCPINIRVRVIDTYRKLTGTL